MEKQRAHGITAGQKQSKAENTEEQAVAYGLFHSAGDPAVFPARLGFGHGGQQHDGNGLCDRGWKQDERQSHACQDAVDGQRF
mgnify:CR=1 FL=1